MAEAIPESIPAGSGVVLSAAAVAAVATPDTNATAAVPSNSTSTPTPTSTSTLTSSDHKRERERAGTRRDDKQNCRVYMSELAAMTPWSDVKAEMNKLVGSVAHVRSFRTAALVEFHTEEDATKAIQMLNGKEFLGSIVSVQVDRKPASRSRPRQNRFGKRAAMMAEVANSIRSSSSPSCQVFVGNLPFATRWHGLKDLGAPFGHVVHADVAMDVRMNRSRGFGTLIFADEKSAAACIAGLHGTQYEDRTLEVRLDAIAQKRADETEPGAKLYVSNLPWSWRWQTLKDIFKDYGDVVRTDIVHDMHTGLSRGFGTVTFRTKASADAAIVALNGKEFDGRALLVKVDQYSANLKNNTSQ
jgi:RNA recognition motif-containing protein